MQVISHRGFWSGCREKNSIEAFKHSFMEGFGTETDFRDLDRKLVISHDPPAEGAVLAESFFGLLASIDQSLPIAINVKSDGLQDMLADHLRRHQIENYFLFDMSIPDALVSISRGLRVFTRQSDVEPDPNFYEQAQGVWLDSFHDESWISAGIVQKHLDAGKKVCLVSPELHGRPHQDFWSRLSDTIDTGHESVMLCTDVPDEADKFFNP